MTIRMTGRYTQIGKAICSNIAAIPPTPAVGTVGVFMGGSSSGGYLNTIEEFDISVNSNTTAFGNLSSDRTGTGSMSNGDDARGVCSGSYNPNTDIMEYFTITNSGSAHSFGELGTTKAFTACASNGTGDKGFIGSGDSGNPIEYYTISTGGSAFSTGSLFVGTSSRYAVGAANGTNDRGIIHIGRSHSEIEYFTISTGSNAAPFSSLTYPTYAMAAVSNDTNDRVVFAGGWSSPAVDVMQYINLASLIDTVDFGDLTIKRLLGDSGVSSGTEERGVFGGGWNNVPSSVYFDRMDYITISSGGNAGDFGNLATAASYVSGVSNSAA